MGDNHSLSLTPDVRIHCRSFTYFGGGASVQKYTHFGSTTVFGRPGQPAELASIYVQLAAKDASFTTGNIYGAGGGQGQP